MDLLRSLFENSKIIKNMCESTNGEESVDSLMALMLGDLNSGYTVTEIDDDSYLLETEEFSWPVDSTEMLNAIEEILEEPVFVEEKPQELEAQFSIQAGMVEELRKLLADTYVVAIKTQFCHWNVVGSNFSELHKLFQEQYEALFDFADEIAENVRKNDAFTKGSMQDFLELSSIPEFEFDPAILEDMDQSKWLVGELFASNQQLLDIVNHFQTYESLSLIDLLSRLSAHLEKSSWMLAASY